MNQKPNVLWLSISPSLKCFDQRLLSHLIKYAAIQRWEYCQTLDEPCCIDDVVASLHEFLSARDYKTHLLGHGVSGIVALLYARRYPERVASLTLLSVGALPAVNWQAHYYALRQLLPCSREMILAQMTRLLFGPQPMRFTRALSHLLARDLDSNLTLHSLAHHTKIPAGATEVPLLVCNGQDDPITFSQALSPWHDWLKPSDRLWHCPKGQHFFHFYHSQAVAEMIAEHWQQLPCANRVVPANNSAEQSSSEQSSSEQSSSEQLVTWRS